MSEKSRLIKNTAWIAFGNMGTKVISFLLLPLYTSILTTTEYGTYDYIVAISAFLFPIFTFSMHESMFRFIIDSKKDKIKFKSIVTNSLFLEIFGLIILGVCLFIFSDLFSFSWIYLYIYIVASSLYTFSNYLLRGLGRMKEYAVISSIKNIFQLCLNVVTIALLRFGLEGLIFSLCFSEVISFVFVVLKCKLWKEINIHYLSKSLVYQMIEYSLPLIPNSLCAQIINLSDRLIISNYLGASANGIYSISYKFPNIIETVYHYFYTAWSESASRVINKGKEAAEEYYNSLYRTLDNAIFGVIICMVSFMPIIFRIFIRGDYVEGFSYVGILMFSMYYNSLSKYYSGIIIALKKTKSLAISTAVGALVNLLINIFLIKNIGLYAAAISTLVAEICVLAMLMRQVNKYVNIRIGSKDIIFKMIFFLVLIVFSNYNNWIVIILFMVICFIFAYILNKQIVNSLFCKLLKNKI